MSQHKRVNKQMHRRSTRICRTGPSISSLQRAVPDIAIPTFVTGISPLAAEISPRSEDSGEFILSLFPAFVGSGMLPTFPYEILRLLTGICAHPIRARARRRDTVMVRHLRRLHRAGRDIVIQQLLRGRETRGPLYLEYRTRAANVYISNCRSVCV